MIQIKKDGQRAAPQQTQASKVQAQEVFSRDFYLCHVRGAVAPRLLRVFGQGTPSAPPGFYLAQII